jgi:hypothetical protein
MAKQFWMVVFDIGYQSWLGEGFFFFKEPLCLGLVFLIMFTHR